jgi:DNA-binding NtrC family response regulator
MFEDRKILVVEDSKHDIERIEALLRELGATYKIATTIREAELALRTESYDFLLSDLHIESRAGFDEPDGLKVIGLGRDAQPNLVIVANSSDPRADIWDNALKAGAQHFLRKPLSRADEIIIAFSLAKERKALTTEKVPKSIHSGRWQQYFEQYPEGIVVDAALINKIKGIAKRNTMTAVLIGETGTGKEEIARLIHKHRCQTEGNIPFVAVNCATLTKDLAESLLFGHRKGAFTGAEQTTNGFVGDADGGILFLDEIHTLDFACQQKLLRVLNDGSYNRLGETRTYRSKFQLIAATTKDLDDEVDAGRFMLDLRSRITGLDIPLLPLRQRKADIDALTAMFLAKKRVEIDSKTFQKLCEKLKEFYWQGNIRQLFKVLDSWLLRTEFEELPLAPEYLPVFKGMHPPHSPSAGSPAADDDSSKELLRALAEDRPFEEAVELFEKTLIRKALSRHASIAETAEALGLPRSTLDAKRRKYQLI